MDVIYSLKPFGPFLRISVNSVPIGQIVLDNEV